MGVASVSTTVATTWESGFSQTTGRSSSKTVTEVSRDVMTVPPYTQCKVRFLKRENYYPITPRACSLSDKSACACMVAVVGNFKMVISSVNTSFCSRLFD